jgi:hypothetical protein
MPELTDFNWTYLTIVYMIFKFFSVKITTKIAFDGTNESGSMYGKQDPNCMFYKRQFATYTEFNNFRTKIIKVVEKFFEQIDWNVFMNPHYYLCNNHPDYNNDERNCQIPTRIMQNNDEYFKNINKFIEDNKHYIDWKKIDFFKISKDDDNYKTTFIPINLHAISIELDIIDTISLI